MKIGVMGDTHGDIKSIRRAVKVAGAVDLWLHTGDHYSDAASLASLVKVPVVAVIGNCDGRIAAKPDEFLEVAGFKLWLTHGHHYGVKNDRCELMDWARRYEADIVVYGHTHRPEAETQSGILFFNPGSTALPNQGNVGTCGVIELSEKTKTISPSLISIF